MNKTTLKAEDVFIRCPRCAGDGLEMCRVDGCDRDENVKCKQCKGEKFVSVSSFPDINEI
jgi:transcription elongation factor Elf1